MKNNQAVKSLIDQYAGGKKPNKLYCNKGDFLVTISVSGNVAIVQGKHGRFPVNINEITEYMISGSKDLISRIKEVDLKVSYVFPIDFVMGITEGKEWESEFLKELEKSDVRESLKKSILHEYNQQNESKKLLLG